MSLCDKNKAHIIESFRVLEAQNALLRNRMRPMEKVCGEILSIMKTYDEQTASAHGIDTPGGMEHMGDVWNLLNKWKHQLETLEEDE